MASGRPGDNREGPALRAEHLAQPGLDDAAVQFQLVGNPGVTGLDVDDAIGVADGCAQPGHGAADGKMPCRLHLALAVGLGGDELRDRSIHQRRGRNHTARIAGAVWTLRCRNANARTSSDVAVGRQSDGQRQAWERLSGSLHLAGRRL